MQVSQGFALANTVIIPYFRSLASDLAGRFAGSIFHPRSRMWYL